MPVTMAIRLFTKSTQYSLGFGRQCLCIPNEQAWHCIPPTNMQLIQVHLSGDGVNSKPCAVMNTKKKIMSSLGCVSSLQMIVSSQMIVK